MSLGSQLAQQAVEREVEKNEAALREQAENARQFAADMTLVANKLAEARRAVERAVSTKLPYKTVEIHSRDGGIHSKAFDLYSWGQPRDHKDRSMVKKSWQDPTNAYHAAWKEFQQWADENDLTVWLGYTWDGGGMESWYLIHIEPKAA